DANGRRSSVTLPSGQVHTFAYSPAGELTGVTPAGSAPYARGLNADRELTRVALPGGRTGTYGRDRAGRPTESGDAAAAGGVGIGSDSAGRVTGLSWTPQAGPAQQTALAYDGELLTAAGPYSYEYDSDLRLASLRLDGGPRTAIGRDADGLVSALGPFAFTRS